MINEKVACPHCDKLVWIPVPDNNSVREVSHTSQFFSLKEFSDQKKKCPYCKNTIYIWFN